MTFEAYSIAVRMKLVDGVSASLGLITRGMRGFSGETASATKNVAELEKRLHSLKNLGLVGGAMAGAGAFGMSLFAAPLKAARDYELAFTKFKTLNLGDVIDRQADKFARSANLMGVSAKDLMGTLSESVGLFGGFDVAQKLAPKIAALNAANSAIFGGKVSHLDEGGSRSLMKFIDRRGGTHDEASFMRNLDLAQKMVSGSGGFVKFRDLDQFSQQAGTAFRGLSDDGILNMALLLQEQGGSRAGTSFMSIFQNLIAGRTPKKTMAMLQEFGLGHLGYQTHATVGGERIKSLVMTGIKDSALLQANPTEWFRSVFLPALAKKGVTSESGILKATNDLLSNRTGSSQASIMSTQLLQVVRDASLAKNAMGFDQTIGAWGRDPNSKFADLNARWTDALRELGTVALPVVIKGVEGLTAGLKTVIHFAQEWPTATKGLVGMFGALAIAAAAGGTIALATTGFKALGLVLGMAGAGGGLGLAGAIAPLIGAGGSLALLAGGILAMGAALGAVAWIADRFGADKKNDGRDHSGEHWTPGHGRSGAGGHWDANKRLIGRGRGYEVWSPTGGVYVPDGPAAGGGRGYINNTIVLPNGEALARVVTKAQTREATKPQAGTSGFDPNHMPMPSGLGSGAH